MKVARLLLNGPLKTAQIQEECAIPGGGSINAVMTCDWFAKENHGMYRITAAGRTAVTGKKAIP